VHGLVPELVIRRLARRLEKNANGGQGAG
jgi:hypothetical protein